MKYVTFSYDDNSYLNGKLLEILNKYHAKCTFNLNSGMITPGIVASFFMGSRKMVPLKEIKGFLSGSGHEVACHGKGHPNFLKLTDEQMTVNITADRETLETIFGSKIQGFAYPFGAYSAEVMDKLKDAGFDYARTTVSTHCFDVPVDFLAWNPTCHHNDRNLFKLADEFVAGRKDGDQIFYIWGHAWEYGVFKNWNRLTELLEILKKDPSIEYLTNGEVFERVKNSNKSQGQ